jgi:transposase
VSALDAVLRKTRDLEVLVAKLRKERAGKHSEQVDPAQLQLLFDQLCSESGPEFGLDPEAEAREDAELDKEIQEIEQASEHPPSRRKRGGRIKTGAVECQMHHVEVPEAEQRCSQCGTTKRRIGEDVTRRLEYVPGHFVEHEYRRDKWACGNCREGVTTAKGPEAVIERSTAGASLLAHVVVSKYVDRCPLHRLHRIYLRSGVEIAVSTLSDWAADVADLAEPLVERLAERILTAYVIGTDATGVRVVCKRPSGRGGKTPHAFGNDERVAA